MGGSVKNTGKQPSAGFYHLKLAIVISFLAWPIVYFLNNAFELIDESSRTLFMMSTGFGILALCVGAVAKLSKVSGWLYYGFVLFSFTCMIDFIIAAEFNGFISGFMSQYLKMGEPYLHSPWGSAISFFDGIGFYFMYLLMIYQISNGKSWRSTGIYWGVGIINSMVVLVFGVLTGKHSPTFCTFLNVPYVIFPIVATIRAFGKEKRRDWNQTASSGFSMKIFDLVLVLGFLGSIWVNMAKGLLSMGSKFTIFQNFVNYEPSLLWEDPAPFAKIQSLVFFFYIIPIQVVCLLYIFSSRKPQILWELGLIQAGIMLEAQFAVIFSSLDPQTPSEFRSSFSDPHFWAVNLLTVVVPHLYLLRLLPHRQSAKIVKKQS